MSTFTALFLLLKFAVSSNTCPSYECKAQNQVFDDYTCSYYDIDDTSYFLSSCSSETFSQCLLKSNTNSSCTQPSFKPTPKWPGESCNNRDNSLVCYIGECVDDICQGSLLGERCPNTNYCNPGHFCSLDKVCVKQFANGDKGCTDEYECENGLGCDGGVCRKYLSVKPNEEISECINSSNLLCESSFCYSNSTTFKNYCLDFLTKLPDNPLKCETDDQCKSEVDPASGTYINPGCQCGLNPDRKKFCGLLPGDIEFRDYLKQLKSWFDSKEIKGCNSNRRFHESCISDNWEYKKALKLSYHQETIANYAKIQMNDYCVESMILAKYYDIAHRYMHSINQDPHNTFTSISTSDALSFFAVINLIIFT